VAFAAARPGSGPALGDPEAGPGGALDRESGRWLTELRRDDPHHHQAVARLEALLLRVARHELSRRAHQLGQIAGPEFDDLAQQAADDAVLAVLAKLDQFKGLSRFTTWAYKFAIVQVSRKVAAHAWQHHPPNPEELGLDHLPDMLIPRPGEQAQRSEQLRILAAAVAGLTPRQREVFVAVALNEVPMDVLALTLDSNRNAIYKNLFDARRQLRQKLAEAGYPVAAGEA
jgi:RNA polymerase sigma-70 factor (ECF subfamily)